MTSNEDKAVSFYELMNQMTDLRDNRGKRHNLAFIVTSVILAILSDRATMSSIHRYITNRIEFLKQILSRPEAVAVSRAQLPRILAGVDFDELNQKIEEFFGYQIELLDGEWRAIDGKTLRGSKKQGALFSHLLSAVVHKIGITLFQVPVSHKTNEIPIMEEVEPEVEPGPTPQDVLEGWHQGKDFVKTK